MRSAPRSESRARAIRFGMFGLFGLTSALAVVYAQPDTKGTGSKHLSTLVSLGKKFEGAGTCGGSNCHGAGATSQVPPTKIGSEFSLWQAKDAHAKAATIVTKPDTKANPWMATIGSKLGVNGDLLTSQQCVSCHGSPVPANLQGEKFAQNEGVSCYQCHGPSEAWRVPHQTKGWTDAQRAKMDHTALLQTHGLFDTRPAVQRAEMCASCHLAIDETLVKAGHPQPIFEQLAFQAEEPEHWIERNAGYARLNLYAAGQVVAMREALEQLAARPGDAAAFDQAAVHVRLVNLLVESKAIDGDAAATNALLGAVEAGKGNDAALKKASTDAAGLAKTLLASIAKMPDTGDKAKLQAALAAITSADVKAFGAPGRRGYEQLFFAVDRLSTAYRDGGKIATDKFKPVRDAGKPLRDLKLFDNRNSPDPVKDADATFTASLKAVGDAVKALP